MKPSEEYKRGIALSLEQNRSRKNNSGKFLLRQTRRIKDIIERLEIKTALDYGCGRGVQYTRDIGNGQRLEAYWGITVDRYDPGYPQFAAEPTGTYDLVISTHALGLVPVQDLEWVIPRIFDMATKAVFIALTTGKRTENLGKLRYRTENIPPPSWTADNWLDLFRRHLPKDRVLEVHFVVRKKEVAAHYVMHAPSGKVDMTSLVSVPQVL